MRAKVDERAEAEAVELQLREPSLVRFNTHAGECATDAQRTLAARSACPECERIDGHRYDCVLRPIYLMEDSLKDRYSPPNIAIYRIGGIYLRMDEPIEPYQ